MRQQAKEIEWEIREYIDPVKRNIFPVSSRRERGSMERVIILGVVVPNTRLVAKRHKDAPFEVMAELLQSQWHECRLCALLMLVERFKKSDERGESSFMISIFRKRRVSITGIW